MLNVILNLYKLEWFNMLQKEMQNLACTEEVLVRELQAASRVALVLPEMTQILREFHNLSPSQAIIEFKNLTL